VVWFPRLTAHEARGMSVNFSPHTVFVICTLRKKQTFSMANMPSCHQVIIDVYKYGLEIEKKVKSSHTQYRALGPELIPVYRQSACR